MTETMTVCAADDAARYQMGCGQNMMPWSSIPANASSDAFTFPSDFVAIPMSQNPLWDMAQPFAGMESSHSYQAYNDDEYNDRHLEGRYEFFSEAASATDASKQLQNALPPLSPYATQSDQPDLPTNSNSNSNYEPSLPSPSEEMGRTAPPSPKRRRRASIMSESSVSHSHISPEGCLSAKSPRSKEANRLAAAKCRSKSRRNISKLQERERSLVLEHRRLVSCAHQLRDEVLSLKTEILRHGDCDSEVIRTYINNAAHKIV
ncbi:hypothetical protein SLS62_003241 [Diatrype stigma]|uniref:BZIP domain-containing protein n=1 Tax=Diatrype stigma TaxID=117547 RepID=A0AAN9YUD6_9PEZI